MQGDGLSPDEAIHAVRLAVERSDLMPGDMSYIEYEPGDNDDTKVPILVLQPLSEIRLSDFNTDFDGFVTDAAGNRVGRIYRSEYRLDLQLDIWTADQSSYDERTLGNRLHNALYEHDSKGPGRPLKADDGTDIDSVWKFRLGDGQSANDLTMSPALRRWRHEVTLWAYHRFDTTKDYTSGVNYPSELSDSGDGTLTS